MFFSEEKSTISRKGHHRKENKVNSGLENKPIGKGLLSVSKEKERNSIEYLGLMEKAHQLRTDNMAAEWCSG